MILGGSSLGGMWSQLGGGILLLSVSATPMRICVQGDFRPNIAVVGDYQPTVSVTGNFRPTVRVTGEWSDC